MGRVIVILICFALTVLGQNERPYQAFINRARDNLVKYGHRVLNRSLKIEDFAPVVTSFQKAVQHSALLQTPIFQFVNTTGNTSTGLSNTTKVDVKRQSFLDGDGKDSGGDTTAYQLDFIRSCTTPNSQNGKCSDLTACPVLLLDLTNLRKSICFQSIFVPGVCCPSDQAVPERITRRPTTTTTTTTQRPTFIADLFQLFSTRPAPVAATPSPVADVRPPLTLKPQDVRPQLTLKPQVFITSNELSNEISQNDGQSFKNKDVCGQITIASLRIVGGEVARVGDWPWMTAIYLSGPNGREYWCGGSLITAKHVLTAAHCTQDGKQKRFGASQFSVELGRTNLISGDRSKMQTFGVTEVRVHPNFRAHGFYNDVAVFKLDGSARYDDYVRPACLPSADDDGFSLVGELPTVIGFGATDYGGRESNILREVQIPVWKNEDCNKAYIQEITGIFICAGYADGGKDACQGDSGGPLQLYKNGNWVQIGLVSFGNKCAEPGYPGVYTRITKFARWIEANSIV